MTGTSALRERINEAFESDPAFVEIVMESFLGPHYRDVDFLNEVALRRERALSEAPSCEAGAIAAADAVSRHDAERIIALARGTECPAVIQLALANTAIRADIRSGLRCENCFRPPAEAQADNHDCSKEC